MQVTDELRVLVEAEVARAIENFKKLSDGVEDSEKKTASLGEALDSLSKKSLIISGVLGGAGIAAIKFAGENEKLKLSLKNMLGSAEEASVVFEDWRRLGTSPGLSVDEVFNLGRAMVNMGHSTEYATSTVEMLGNVAAGTGVSFGEISSSFERARAMGNLTSRDLVRLQQQGIPIVKELAKVMGTSEESIRQMASEGKIGFDVLERSFRSMTGPGGQFAGMMNELSGTVLEKFSTASDDAKQALAAFGELLLPMATELLDSASSILNGITDMDEGTKRFILTMGGIIAVSGPAVKAIKGIHAAITMLTANPVLLGIGAAAAGIGLLVTIFGDANVKMDQASRDYEASLRRITRGNQDLIRDGSFEEASTQIRGLTKSMYEAAAASGNFSAAVAGANKLTSLTHELNKILGQTSAATQNLKIDAMSIISILETPVNPDAVNTNWVEEAINGFTTLEAKVNEAVNHMRSGSVALQQYLEHGNQAWIDAVAANNADAMLEVLRNINATTPATQAEIDRIHREINEIASGVTINPVQVSVTPTITTSNSRKTWQEWFEEITNIDRTRFGNSGAIAAQLYLDGFDRTLTAQSNIAEALGGQIDVAAILRNQQTEVQKTLVELFSIDPTKINSSFTLADNSISRLINEYQRLGEEVKKLEDSLKISDTLDNLSRAVQNLGKDQHDLALETLAASDATEEEIKQAEELIETLRTAGMSFEDLVAHKISSGLLNVFPELEKQAAQALGNISAQLAMISFDSAIKGLNAVGELLAKGSDGADDFKEAMANISQQILSQLPTMFLQAGLQLIAQGQWALGLGFVAAAGSSALIAGYVEGRKDSATANAHGNAFDARGVIPYAHGGSFTNQIVNKPTYFRHGGKLGVMGEAGPESIMPLKRMANGDLGVAASGNGSSVTINIINNSGEEVHQKETENADGSKQIDVIIGDMMNNHLGSGQADGAMRKRYGLRAVGV